MIPVHVDLPNALSGDTWEGLSIGPVQFNGAQPAEALASCKLYFRNLNNALSYGFVSASSTRFGRITITDPITWCVSIPTQSLPLVAGQYKWDFETTDVVGVVRTLYKGTLTVEKDVSYD